MGSFSPASTTLPFCAGKRTKRAVLAVAREHCENFATLGFHSHIVAGLESATPVPNEPIGRWKFS